MEKKKRDKINKHNGTTYRHLSISRSLEGKTEFLSVNLGGLIIFTQGKCLLLGQLRKRFTP